MNSLRIVSWIAASVAKSTLAVAFRREKRKGYDNGSDEEKKRKEKRDQSRNRKGNDDSRSRSSISPKCTRGKRERIVSDW